MQTTILWIANQNIKVQMLEVFNPVSAMHVWETVWSYIEALAKEDRVLKLPFEEAIEFWKVVWDFKHARPVGIG